MRTNRGHALLVDEDVRDRGADVDDGLFAALFVLHADLGHADGARHGERHQVDAHRLQLGGQRHVDDRVHHRPLRGDEDQPQHAPSVLLELAERVEVQDGVLDRHRDELLRLEPERRPELLLGEPRERDLANHHPLVPHTHVDLPALEPAALPQLAERLAHQLGLTDLAGLDGSFGQGHLRRANDDRRVPSLELGGAHRGGADIESDPYLGHLWTLRPDGAFL